MKKWIFIITIFFVLLLGSMFVSKPSKAKYTQWLTARVEERIGDENFIIGLGFDMFGKQIIDKNTAESDFLFWKVYETEFQGKKITCIGIYQSFIPIGKKGF
ncbi:hypothetical protein [Metabacillus arenae]|uniref:DUF4359 domain-containing protein n=1 Tax=Metabacillus arenae TaxID=2771434 RepID=A0A926NG73_9BACI|nr:hypothetical protein [Metabacillus arenae]MBD1380515.1 hypothetical protein [Metabacillus arenae]